MPVLRMLCISAMSTIRTAMSRSCCASRKVSACMQSSAPIRASITSMAKQMTRSRRSARPRRLSLAARWRNSHARRRAVAARALGLEGRQQFHLRRHRQRTIRVHGGCQPSRWRSCSARLGCARICCARRCFCVLLKIGRPLQVHLCFASTATLVDGARSMDSGRFLSAGRAGAVVSRARTAHRRRCCRDAVPLQPGDDPEGS